MSENEIYKTIFIGESGVGKSSLIARISPRDIKFNSGIFPSTNYQMLRNNVKIPGFKRLYFDMWDTPAQNPEYLKKTLNVFMKDATVVFLVYDITSQESFERMKNRWYGEISNTNNEKVIVGIVANKSDLNEKRQVNDEDGKAFAEEKGAFFVSTSALNRNGFQDLFKNMVQRISDTICDFREDENKEKEEEENIWGEKIGKKEEEENIWGEKIGSKKKEEERVKLKSEKKKKTEGKKNSKCC